MGMHRSWEGKERTRCGLECKQWSVRWDRHIHLEVQLHGCNWAERIAPTPHDDDVCAVLGRRLCPRDVELHEVDTGLGRAECSFELSVRATPNGLERIVGARVGWDKELTEAAASPEGVSGGAEDSSVARVVGIEAVVKGTHVTQYSWGTFLSDG
jgi:hypothetical protein